MGDASQFAFDQGNKFLQTVLVSGPPTEE